MCLVVKYPGSTWLIYVLCLMHERLSTYVARDMKIIQTMQL